MLPRKYIREHRNPGDADHSGAAILGEHSNGNDLVAALKDKGIDVNNVPIDPSLPEMSLQSGAFGKWIGMMDDVDETCIKCVDYLKNHPLIPNDIVVSGWIWETEFRRLRAPTTDVDARARTQYSAASMGVQGSQPPRWG